MSDTMFKIAIGIGAWIVLGLFGLLAWTYDDPEVCKTGDKCVMIALGPISLLINIMVRNML